jgi:hypothetical protein
MLLLLLVLQEVARLLVDYPQDFDVNRPVTLIQVRSSTAPAPPPIHSSA